MRETPVDPRKIRGKFAPEKKSTDINADPIDNPPEKSFRKNLPKERAEFVDTSKNNGGKMPDSLAVFLGGIMTVMSFVSGFVTLAGSGFAGLLRAMFALAAIILVARDISTFRSGQIIAVVAAILFFVGMMAFVSFAASVAP